MCARLASRHSARYAGATARCGRTPGRLLARGAGATRSAVLPEPGPVAGAGPALRCASRCPALGRSVYPIIRPTPLCARRCTCREGRASSGCGIPLGVCAGRIDRIGPQPLKDASMGTPPSSAEPDGGRLFFQSETFTTEKRPRRPASSQTVQEPGRTLPVHATCDVLVGGRWPGRNRGCHGSGAVGRRRRVAGTVQPPGWAFHRRFGYLDRPHVGLDRQARDPGRRGRTTRPASSGRPGRAATRRLGIPGCDDSCLLGAADGRVPRHRQPRADLGPRVVESGITGHGDRCRRAPGVPRLGRCTAP